MAVIFEDHRDDVKHRLDLAVFDPAMFQETVIARQKCAHTMNHCVNQARTRFGYLHGNPASLA